MNKRYSIVILVMVLMVLASCGQQSKKTTNEKNPTDNKDALMYTFEIDKHDYRFRLLDGWVRFPDKDSKIVFLVANKDIKSFMTAGFEEKQEKSLESYKEDYLEKLKEAGAIVNEEPKKETVNDLDVYHVGFTSKDNKNRTLTYRTNLIETSDYFINLGAWTSQESPSKEIIDELDTMLVNFEQLK
ncbi:MAG: hypothetical protein ACTJHC_03920 [Vagococcus sp.]